MFRGVSKRIRQNLTYPDCDYITQPSCPYPHFRHIFLTHSNIILQTYFTPQQPSSLIMPSSDYDDEAGLPFYNNVSSKQSSTTSSWVPRFLSTAASFVKTAAGAAGDKTTQKDDCEAGRNSEVSHLSGCASTGTGG